MHGLPQTAGPSGTSTSARTKAEPTGTAPTTAGSGPLGIHPAIRLLIGTLAVTAAREAFAAAAREHDDG